MIAFVWPIMVFYNRQADNINNFTSKVLNLHDIIVFSLYRMGRKLKFHIFHYCVFHVVPPSWLTHIQIYSFFHWCDIPVNID